MARNYIRPEIPESLYEQMTQGRIILINPDLDELKVALNQVQTGTRERRLDRMEITRAWQDFNHHALAGIGLAKSTEAPAHYRWALDTTLFQMIRITPTLIGVVLERTAIKPGQSITWPVPGATTITEQDQRWQGSAIERRNHIVTAFWLHLSDTDMRELDAYTTAA
jgi:hypothetical protein